MTVTRTQRFKKSFRKLPATTRNKFAKQITYLLADSKHPSLGVRKLQGEDDLWEARVDYHYRFVFRYAPDAIILLNIGTHQIYGRV
jgi:mRNA-degrading endonuclease RelE of RelBE toxin-antitoxin system